MESKRGFRREEAQITLGFRGGQLPPASRSKEVCETVGQVILYGLSGALTTALLLLLVYFWIKSRVTYTALTIDDLIDSFQHIKQELLLQIAEPTHVSASPQEQPAGLPMPNQEVVMVTRRVMERVNRKSYSHRRHLRLNLGLIQDYTQRMLHNTAIVGNVAYSDLRKMREHKLKYPPDALDAIYALIDADRAFRKFARSVLRKTWFWSVLRFQERTWGPIPNFATFQIQRMLEAYIRAKKAAEAYALFYGDVGKLISEEIKVKM